MIAMLNRAVRSSVMALREVPPKVSRARGASLQGHIMLLLQPKRENSTVTSIYTEKTYAPFSHYSQAIKAGGHVWLSGQIPADAQGNLITGSVTEKTRAIIQNTEALLKEAGSGFEGVVKVVVYVTDASIMPEFSQVYDRAFPHKPARSMVVVSKLPAGVDIQVDFIAIVQDY